jgi:pyruvate formate lyase activating enzyme
MNMLIAGLQKLTLLDYPGKVACTVFTGGCNFRCPFCHNSALVLPEQLSQGPGAQEILAFLRKRVGVLDGVAVTGGEPLLHPDIDAFLKEIKAMGFLVKLDTNGSFPERLIALVEAGLVDRVAMDVKNAPALYAKTAGLPESFDLAGVTRSRDFLLSGAVDYEFRTTVVRGLHTAESLVEAARWIEGAKEYYLQQYTDSGAILAGEGLAAFDAGEMQALAEAVRPIVPTVQVRGV